MTALDITGELIDFPTVSYRSNAAISEHLEHLLRRLGFDTERVDYRDAAGVTKSNVLGKRGSGQGGMAYFGHTDVVPADMWDGPNGDPFKHAVKGNRLYGRGSCDMKGSIGSMLAAAWACRHLRLNHPLYIVLTADEEIGYGGAKQVVHRSDMYREMMVGRTRGIVGEPTMLQVVHAHKGTYGFKATTHGRAAHSSTSKGINANLRMIPFLSAMKEIHDETRDDPKWNHPGFDPPGISWNIGINDHTRAVNMTAARSVCTVYFRPAPGHCADALIDRARDIAERCGAEFELLESGQPLYMDPDSEFVGEVLALSGNRHARTVCYGTDGAVLSGMERLVVMGPGDIAQAHTADEWIDLEQLESGTELYSALIRRWCH